MRVERWSPAEHAEMYIRWHHARGIGDAQAYDLTLRWLPPTGFVVDRCVAGFLFKTDAKQAYVGAIAGDPKVSKQERRIALEGLLHELAQEAKSCGYEAVAGLPTVESLAKVFSDSGYTLVLGQFAIRRV